MPEGGAAGRACAPSLAGGLATTRAAEELVTVTSSSPRATTGELQLWRRQAGCWVAAGGPWSAYLGFAGISDHHREGDGTTPAGAFSIGRVLYGVAPDPGVSYPYHRIVCGDWWDEDPTSPAYNTFRQLQCGAQPSFGGASEPLWKSARAYAHFAFIQYNVHPAVPGLGSGIFIHDDHGGPTNGCVSLPPAELVTLLRWLRPNLHPLVVIGTRAEIARY